jgi:hypothetical protein
MRMGTKYAHFVKYTDAADILVWLKKNAHSHKPCGSLQALKEVGFTDLK